jgi:hypothetical protein
VGQVGRIGHRNPPAAISRPKKKKKPGAGLDIKERTVVPCDATGVVLSRMTGMAGRATLRAMRGRALDRKQWRPAFGWVGLASDSCPQWNRSMGRGAAAAAIICWCTTAECCTSAENARLF